jgi:porin
MKYVFVFWTITLAANLLIAQQDIPENNNTFEDSGPITNKFTKIDYSTSYTGDFFGNLTGGKKTGTAYLGIANIRVDFNTKKLGLWEGGEFFINGACTHGATPSEKLIGDFQVASNIEAGNHIFIHELWYKHSVGKTEITVGLQDLNVKFLTSAYSGSFINSSFGVPSLISDNVPVPIFPLTALGITGSYKIHETIAIQAALYDGLPELFDNNQYNVAWDLNRNDGALIFTELQFSTLINGLPGSIKTGGYYHSHLKEMNEETGFTETVFDNNYGFYLIADQLVLQKSEGAGVGLFAQVAVSPSGLNRHNYYLGGGINYSGIFNNDTDNLLGLAFAHAGFKNDSLKDETTIEMFYKTNIADNIFIQPDIQYIINPSGTEDILDNAVAVFMRFGINF